MMNKIEKAIEYLEPLAHYVGLTGGYAEALKVAVKALREQQERERPVLCRDCVYHYEIPCPDGIETPDSHSCECGERRLPGGFAPCYWIDAEAETPDIGQSVLIYLPDEDADQICVGEYLGEGNYRIGQKIHRGCEIGAWMPAPKPPKEEGEKPVDLQAEEIKKEKKWKEYEDDALRTSLAKAIPLDRLAEIVDAELGHRLIVLPNNAFIKKAGETLYLLDEGDIVEVMHCGAEIGPDGKISATVIADDNIFQYREPDAERDLDPNDWCTNEKTITPEDIGKTVFYTREHAERAQKGDV